MVAIRRRRPPWSGCFYFTSLHLANCVQMSATTQKSTKNQLLSNQLGINFDAPGYKKLLYDTEEQFYD